MKKTVLIVFAMLLLVACSTKEPKEPEVVESENNVEQEELENESTEPEETPEIEEPNNEDEKAPKKPKYSEVDELKNLTLAIFTAQNDNDYAFLESVLSSGSKLNKTTNTFTFNNVSYPHEQEFLTENNAADLEYRYIHDEDKKSVIVGFAAADYENEYNYIIDFEFILENGSYKMNDMDINK